MQYPSNWKVGAIGSFFETATGTTPPKSQKDNYGSSLPFVKPPELLDSEILDTSDNLSEKGALLSRILPSNSILISCIGNLGKVGINSKPVAFNQQINAIKANESLISKFMFYQALSPEFKLQLEELASGTTVPIVNKSKFNSIKIVLPPLETQKQIVAKLDQAFADIEKAKANAEQNLKNARELFDSYLQKIYTDSNYNESKLGELVDVLTDYHANGSYKVLKQHVDLKESEDFAWMVRSTDFEKNFKNEKRYINEAAYNYLKKTPIFGGEIIMSKIGNAGKVYLMPEITRPCSLAMNLFLIRLNEKLVNNEYVFRYLNSKSGKAQIAPLLNGAATQTITKDSVRSLNIPLPSLKEQSEVISKLNLLEEKIVSLENIYRSKISAINELKQSILQKAFNGELA